MNAITLKLPVAAAAFATGYVSYGIITGNWGMKAVTTGLTSAALSTGGFCIMGGAATVSSALIFAGKDAANTLLSYVIQPINFEVLNFGFSISPIAMLTAGIGDTGFGFGEGFRYGAGISVSREIGDWTLTAGMTTEGSSIGNMFGGFAYDDGHQGFSYDHTAYMQEGSKQRTGTIGARSGNWSMRWENDFMGDKNDRFRSNATEIGYKDYMIGTNVFTNNPKDEHGFSNDFLREDGTPGDRNFVGDKNGSKIFDNKYGTYNRGQKLSSPAYFGMKNRNGITRIGINSPIIGDFIQNGFHHLPKVESPNFNPGSYKTSGYMQSGTYSSNSLY